MSCEDAELSLEPDQVVAKIDGAEVLAKSLGEQVQSEEQDALREYCAKISKVRQIALENHINETIILAKAKSAGLDEEAYISAELQKRVAIPNDEELLAVYKERASDAAPPFEKVKGQVLQMVMEERQQKAIVAIVDAARAGVKVEKLLPDVRPKALEMSFGKHVAFKGPSDAKVTVVEFADFECPYCKNAAAALSQSAEAFKGKSVRFAYVHFPLSFHKNAQGAAIAAQCASEQNKFWEMHDKIYSDPSKLQILELRDSAEAIGLDLAKYDACLASERPNQQVELDKALGAKVGVRGTPSLYINGHVYQGQLDPQSLSTAIEAALAN